MLTESHEYKTAVMAMERELRIDNIEVDGLIVPAGYLAQHGVIVTVIRELSAFNSDGSIALAGESYHHCIHFTGSTTALDERRVFKLPGHQDHWWSQATVDSECAYMLDRQYRYLALTRQIEDRRAQAERDEMTRAAQRKNRIAHYFDQYGKPANTFRTGSRVATSDGLIWRLAGKSENWINLQSFGDAGMNERTIHKSDKLVPGNAEGIRKFRYHIA